MRGRPTRLVVPLSAEDRATCAAWQQDPKVPAAVARRGRILLLFAAQHSLAAIGRQVGMERSHVRYWLTRYQAHGLAGLQERREDKPTRMGAAIAHYYATHPNAIPPWQQEAL